MAQKGLRSGKSFKAQYKNYANNNQWETNLIAKLERTVKRQPNNEQDKVALDKALAGKAKYNRNKRPEHECKGMSNLFGYEKNKVPPKSYKVVFSKIWHTSTNFAKWFLPSAPKVTKNKNTKGTLQDAWIRSGAKKL